MKISIIIPVLNEEKLLREQLHTLQNFRLQGHEVIVVDGGSQDGSSTLPTSLYDRLLAAPRGRAVQMNAGAREAGGDILLFLHVDTRLPADAPSLIENALSDASRQWGRFNVRLSGNRLIYRIIAGSMDLRSRATGVVTGDQGMFVRKTIFQQIRGFAPIPLMEDIEISRRLRPCSWPVRIPQSAVTSSRRWEQQGALRTVVTMWWLRLRFFFGADPDELSRIYYKNNV